MAEEARRTVPALLALPRPDPTTSSRPQDDAKKGLDAPGFESGAFESLENDFQEVRTAAVPTFPVCAPSPLLAAHHTPTSHPHHHRS